MKKFIVSLLILAQLVWAPAWAATYKYCRCDAGGVGPAVHELCQAGTGDASNGDGLTLATTRITPTLAQLNAALAGDRFEFCAGGKWSELNMGGPWNHGGDYTTNPVVLTSYAPSSGATGRPVITNTSGSTTVFTVGSYISSPASGGCTRTSGYKFDGLYFHGAGTTTMPPSSNYPIFIYGHTGYVTIENSYITGWRSGILAESVSMPDRCGASYTNSLAGVHFLAIRNNDIVANWSQGMLVTGRNALIEGNRVVGNNIAGNRFNHGLYFAGGVSNYVSENVVIRNNLWDHNSVRRAGLEDPIGAGSTPTGDGVTCYGGNLTVRQSRKLLIEGNTVLQDEGYEGCWGISQNYGYSGVTDEEHTDVIIRGNKVVNTTNCGIASAGAVPALIENNEVINRATTNMTLGGICLLGDPPESGQPQATIRNNTIDIYTGTGIAAANPGTPSGDIVTNNVINFWGTTGNRYCFTTNAKSTYAAFDNNLCYNASRYSDDYWTIGTETADCPSGTASFDCNGSKANPQLSFTPGPANNWSLMLEPASPAVGGGSSAAGRCARLTKDGKVRTGTCTMGAFQPGL